MNSLSSAIRRPSSVLRPPETAPMSYHKLREKWATETAHRKALSARLKMRLLKKGVPILKQYGIGKAILFGSLQHGKSHAQSDIDLLVFPLASKQYWDFRHDLEQALDFPVDVYTQTDDPVFIRKMKDRGETIYEAQP